MKTLYISDIDRTLRPPSGMTERTLRLFEKLSTHGVLTSVSTGRGLSSALHALGGLRLTAPIAVMTGAVIYDCETGRQLVRHTIDREAAESVISAAEEAEAELFIYTSACCGCIKCSSVSCITHNSGAYNTCNSVACIASGTDSYKPGSNTVNNTCSDTADEKPPSKRAALTVYHRKLRSSGARDFRSMRNGVAGQVFIETESLSSVLSGAATDIIYAVAVSPHDLSGRDIPGVRSERFEEHANGSIYTEFFSASGGKDVSALEIKRLTGAEKLVGFGDNYNDLALASVCDEFYAVENAVDALKAVSRGVVPESGEDGVARFICERERIEIE